MDTVSASSTGDTLTRRIATAIVGIPLLALGVWLGGITLFIIVAAATFLGIWEMRALLRRFGRVLWPLSAVGAGTFLYSAHIDDLSPSLVVLSVIAGGSLGAALFTYRTGSWDGGRSWAVTVATAIYPGALLASGLALRELAEGVIWLTYAITVTFVSDTAAYAVGKLIGRHKLAPSISPGKTWEGAIGAVVAAAAVSAAFLLAIEPDGMALGGAILLGAALSTLAQIGDLVESWLKRAAGAKDSGTVLPGHGGILDRLDSLLFVLPAVFLNASTITIME